MKCISRSANETNKMHRVRKTITYLGTNANIIITIYILLICSEAEQFFVAHRYRYDPVDGGSCTGAPVEFRDIENATYIIGGLIPLHYFNKQTNKYDYHSTGLMWVESMLFAIKEINNSTDLLPNATLGYRIFNSCGTVSTALEATLQLINGDTLESENKNGSQATLTNKHLLWSNHTAFNSEGSRNCQCKPSLNRIIGLVGDAPSSNSAKVSALLSASKTPQISYSSTSTELSDKSLFPSFMRTIPPDNFQAVVMVDLMLHFNWTYVNIVACDNLYGRIGVNELQPLMQRRGICIANLEMIDVRTAESDLIKKTITKLKTEKDATVIVLWCQLHDAMRVFKAAEEMKLYHRTWIATESYGSSSKVYEIDHRVVAGMFGIIPAQVTYQPYAKALKSITPNNSDNNPWIEEYWISNKHCNKIIENISPTTTPKYRCPDKNTDLTKLPTKKYVNVFDAVYAVAHGLHNYLINNSQESSSKIISQKTLPQIDLAILSDYVKNVSFTGKSNTTISFNAQGNPEQARYAITNVKYNVSTNSFSHLTIGIWNSDTKKVQLKRSVRKNQEQYLQFSNLSNTVPRSSCAERCTPGFYGLKFGDTPCCWKCVQCPDGEVQPEPEQNKCIKCGNGMVSNQKHTICITPKVIYLTLTGTAGGVIFGLMIVSYFLISVCVVIFFINRHTPIVKASNKKMTCLQIISMFFQLALPTLHYQWKIDIRTGIICGVEIFYFIFFTTITISIIFVKADHLLRIFTLSKNCQMARDSVTKGNAKQYFTVCILTLIGLGIGVVLFIIFQPTVMREVRNHGDKVHLTYHCGASQDVILFSTVLYIVFISLICSIYAFKARKLPQDFNEARFTSFAMFTFVLLWVMAVPIYFSQTNKIHKKASWCILCVLSTVVIFVPMYLPKVYIIVFRPEENTLERFRENLKRELTMSSYSVDERQ